MLSVSLCAQNFDIDINYNIDSVLHATSTENVQDAFEFIVKISDTQFLTCSKQRTNNTNENIYNFKLLDDRFSIINSVSIYNEFYNISDIQYKVKMQTSTFGLPITNRVLYIVDNILDESYIYEITLDDLISLNTSSMKKYSISNFKNISKIVLNPLNDDFYCIGVVNNKSAIAYVYPKIVGVGNSAKIIESQNDSIFFSDLALSQNGLYSLSKYEGKIILRKFNPTTLVEQTRSSRNLSTSPIFNQKFALMNGGNVVVALSYEESNNVYREALLFFNQNLVYQKGYFYNESYQDKYISIKDLFYSSSEDKLYIIRSDAEKKMRIGQIDVANYTLSISAKERGVHYNSCLEKFINLNNRFIVTIGTNENGKEHFFKCSKNIEKISTNCDQEVYVDFVEGNTNSFSVAQMSAPYMQTVLSNRKYIIKDELLSSFSIECCPIILEPPIITPNESSRDKMIYKSEDLLVYPNPAKEYITISLPITIDRIELYNMLGELVCERNVNENTSRIYIGDCNKGIYLLKIYFGEKMIIHKIIIE